MIVDVEMIAAVCFTCSHSHRKEGGREEGKEKPGAILTAADISYYITLSKTEF